MGNKLIAITGGIGSGKSTVLSILKEMGYKTVSCDELSKKLTDTHIIKKEIAKFFPDCVSGDKKLRLNKEKLKKTVFTDAKKRRQLEDIIHPLVLKTALKKAKFYKGTVFIEVPVLFERGYERYFDKIIVVKRDEELRIASAMERLKETREQILSRINSQINYEKIDEKKYLILENNGEVFELKNKIFFALKLLNL